MDTLKDDDSLENITIEDAIDIMKNRYWRFKSLPIEFRNSKNIQMQYIKTRIGLLNKVTILMKRLKGNPSQPSSTYERIVSLTDVPVDDEVITYIIMNERTYTKYPKKKHNDLYNAIWDL